MNRLQRQIVIVCTTCTFLCTHAAHADWNRHRTTGVAGYGSHSFHSYIVHRVADDLTVTPLFPWLKQEFEQDIGAWSEDNSSAAENSNR